MTLVFGQDEFVAKWVGSNLGQEIHLPCVAIGATRDGQTLCGGVVVNGYNASNADLTLYGPGCFTRGNIAALYDYLFNQLRLNRATARTRRSNARMRRTLPRLGFTFEGTAKSYFGPDRSDDALLYALFPAQAEKWMR